MSIAQLLSKAREMGVTLRLDGDTVKVGGPKAARDEIKPELAAHKPEIIEHLRAAANDPGSIPADCVGALRSSDGGLYLPWGPCFSPDDVRRMRCALVAMIEQLAELEEWSEEHREDVLARAIRSPLADLLPNLHYFQKQLAKANAAAAARAAVAARSWRFDR